jgi:hypothetical protein
MREFEFWCRGCGPVQINATEKPKQPPICANCGLRTQDPYEPITKDTFRQLGFSPFFGYDPQFK